MTTLKHSQQIDWLETELQLMSSVVASLAKTSALPEKAQDSQEREADYGLNFTGSSPKSNRVTRLSKTSQPFDLKDWTKFSAASLRSGMTRNGTVYPLPPLALPTAGTESGSWPTPTAVWRPMEGNVRILRAKVLAGEMTEAEATAMIGKSPFEAQGVIPAMWPTPTAKDSASSARITTRAQKWRDPKNLSLATLTDAARLWPTPDASPHKYRLRGDSQQSKSLNGIHGGKLNPMWVEWLMGFPLGWTDLKPSEMPSSRKYRKYLDK